MEPFVDMAALPAIEALRELSSSSPADVAGMLAEPGDVEAIGLALLALREGLRSDPEATTAGRVERVLGHMGHAAPAAPTASRRAYLSVVLLARGRARLHTPLGFDSTTVAALAL